MKKSIIAIILCAAMIAGLSVTAFAAPADITEGAWYYEGVKYCLDNNIMTGVSDSKFNPDGVITRGQFVTSLYRIAKNDGKGFSGDWMYLLPFADTAEIPTYAYEAIAWFNQNKIIEGHANGCFDADEPISREQMATILYRYVKFCGEGFEGDWVFLLPCEDRAEISDWAYEAVCWCYMNEIIKGKNGNKFDPNGTAKRAEAALVLQRFCGGENAEEPIDVPITGGWAMNTEFGEFEIPEDAKAAFDKAIEGLVGSLYEPVAYLGCQVVAGLNYAFLCKVTPIVPNAEPVLKVFTIYKDLKGGASLLDATPAADAVSDDAVEFGGLVGGFDVNDACGGGLDDAAKAAFDKATEALLGVGYEPIALLGTQVVAGMNYAVLCKATPVVPNANSALAVLVIYADLEGGASVTSVNAFN